MTRGPLNSRGRGSCLSLHTSPHRPQKAASLSWSLCLSPGRAMAPTPMSRLLTPWILWGAQPEVRFWGHTPRSQIVFFSFIEVKWQKKNCQNWKCTRWGFDTYTLGEEEPEFLITIPSFHVNTPLLTRQGRTGLGSRNPQTGFPVAWSSCLHSPQRATRKISFSQNAMKWERFAEFLGFSRKLLN